MVLVLLLTLVLVIMDTLVINAPNGTVSVINVVATERVMHLISVGVTKDSTDKLVKHIIVAEWYSIRHKHVLETEHVSHQIPVLVNPVSTVQTAKHIIVAGPYSIVHPYVPLTALV